MTPAQKLCKVHAVITSCQTLAQLSGARQYLQLYIDQLPRNHYNDQYIGVRSMFDPVFDQQTSCIKRQIG
jgi:hypothetical protein